MLRNILYLILLLTAKSNCCIGQVLGGRLFDYLANSDTFRFEKLSAGAKYYALDSLHGKIVDTFNISTVHIIKKNANPYIDYFIAIKTGDYFSVYPILRDSIQADSLWHVDSNFLVPGYTSNNLRHGHVRSAKILKLEKYNFQNSKSNIILIHFSTLEYNSNNEGSSRVQTGYQIWDLDKLQLLVLINEEVREYWPYGSGTAITSMGTLQYWGCPISFRDGIMELLADGEKKKYDLVGDQLILIK